MPAKRRAIVIAAVTAAFVAAGVTCWRAMRRSQCEAASCSADSEAEVEPHLAVHGDGTLALAWMAVREQPEQPNKGLRKAELEADAADAIGVRLSRDGGRSWQAPMRIEEPGRFAADPVLVAGPGSGFDLVWLSFRQNLAIGGDPYDMRIRTTRIGPARSAVIDLSGGEPRQQVDKPWAARGADGKLLVAFRYGTPSDRGLALVRSDGASVQRATLVHGPRFAGGLPSLCAGASEGRAWVAYIDPSRGAMLVNDSGDGNETRVSTDQEKVAMEAPTCLARGESVWVLYGVEARPSDPRESALLSHAVIARSKDAGRTFGVRTELRDDDPMMHPIMAFGSAGKMVLAWYAGKGDTAGGGQLRWVSMGEEGALQGSPKTLRAGMKMALLRDDPAWVGDYMAVAGSWIAFGDNRSGRSHVEVVELGTGN